MTTLQEQTRINPRPSSRRIGVLSDNLKEILNQNLSQLCAIKGNLLSTTGNVDTKTILVTSSNPSEGKTISAISMAYGLAELKARVLLIDGNLRCPAIHKHFGVKVKPGLSDLVLSGTEYCDAIRETKHDCLTIMPAGTKKYYSIDIFRSDSINDVLNHLKQQFDYIIFDGHSILISSDVSVIANHFDGIIIVAECEKTKINTLQEAKAKIEHLGGNILGVVLNKRKYYVPKIIYENL